MTLAHPIQPKLTHPIGLDLRGVRAQYGAGPPVLCDVSATLPAGRVTAILGPNAAGKSSLLKVMLGQLAPTAGTATLDGWPIREWAGPRLSRRVSYVPQAGGASFAFSVREVVEMGRFAHGDRRYVEEGLRRCGLSELAARPVTSLSGGQRQRVLIARAWVQSRVRSLGDKEGAVAGWGDPGAVAGSIPGGAVLADEPASSLDLNHAYQMMGLLAEMAAEGLAVAVVLHGLDLASRWADDVWLMDAGRIVAQGPADTVLRRDVLEPVYGVRLAELNYAGRTTFRVEGLAGVID